MCCYACLAYYVEWHLRKRLKLMLFDDEQLEQVRCERVSPLTKALRSQHAQ
jgi:hypothetical protein